jgi:hypothetical protein
MTNVKSTLAFGVTSEDVTLWQNFLVGTGLVPGFVVNGIFDEATLKATRIFQRFYGLNPSGSVDNASLAEAARQGFVGLGLSGPMISPPPPAGKRSLTVQETVRLYGGFSYTPASIPSNPEAIRIDPTWVKENIVRIPRPDGYSHVTGMPSVLHFHRLVAGPAEKLLKDWVKFGLADRVRVWGGDWVPRFVRGSVSTLSNHSFGSALDVNPLRNGLGTVGAPVGSSQSVRELVSIAADNGWWWGGWWGYRGVDDEGGNITLNGRPDPMHFQYGVVDR